MNNRISRNNKEAIIKELNDYFKSVDGILFAVVHGSFLQKNTYNDIDCAVFLDVPVEHVADYELTLETSIILELSLPAECDVRVLNNAPIDFRFNTIRESILLFSHDEDIFNNFKEQTILEYHDFSFFLNNYLRELHASRL
ncbi:MAG: nucleotidyltransferase domain-containing protein [Spirochaetota bacterium]